MDINRCFEILKLSPDALAGEVNQAHRDLVNVWHPDRFAGNPRLRQKGEDQLKEINMARDCVLSFLSGKRKTSPGKVDVRARAEAVIRTWAKARAKATKKEETRARAEAGAEESAGAKARAGTRTKKRANARDGIEAKAKGESDAKSHKIRMIKDRVSSLPLIDVTVWEVISLLDNPDSNFEQIVEELSPDIAARFLSMASSAFYGREVRSISYAVRLLGYSEMKKLLITSILMDHFTRRLEDFSFEKFQKQAHFCAAVSRILGKILDYGAHEDLFTVGILHNIGKLVLAVYFKKEHRKIIDLKKAEALSTSEAEKRITVVTHAEIGALVLERFNIPKSICEAVRFHDAKDRIIPKDADFQLELISRESAGIVSRFTLPQEIEPLKIIELLKETIREGKEIYRADMKKKLLTKGYRSAFPSMLNQASKLVIRDLKKILPERLLS